MYFVLAYFACLAYLGLAAISPQATTLPNTWSELARVAIVFTLTFGAAWFGSVISGRTVIVQIPLSRELTNGDRD